MRTPVQPDRPVPATEPVRILVVDDNADALEAMKLLLETAGYEILTTNNGDEALAIQEQRPAAVLITDLFMPHVDGFETLAHFRRRWPGMKILVVSGGATLVRCDYLRLAVWFGADATLQKPFKPEQLLKTLATFSAAP